MAQIGRPLQNYFRTFSTTQSHFDEANNGRDDGNGKPPSVRERGREAASVINSLRSKGAQLGIQPVRRVGLQQNQQQQQQQQQQPKVLDVKSLPRGIGRGNRFTPRGGGAGTARGGGQTGRPSVPGASRGRGGRGAMRSGRGRGGGGGGRGGRSRGKEKGEEGKDDKKNAQGPKGADPFDRLDSAELELDNAMRFGVTDKYEPKMDVNSVLEFAPASGVNAAGQRAAVMQQLSMLGAGEHVGAPMGLVPRSNAEGLEQQGMRFFASPAEKEVVEAYLQEKKRHEELAKQQPEGAEAAEGESAAQTEGEGAAKADTPVEPIITSAEESVREAIVDAAVAGKHEAPAFATDMHSIVRSLQLRSVSYKAKDMAAFMAKLEKLAGPPKPAAPERPAAKKAEPKAKKATKKAAKAAEA